MGSLPLNTFDSLDPDNFFHESTSVVHFLADYYRNIHSYPVASRVEPGYLRHRIPDAAPYLPHTLDSILEDVKDHIIPGLTHWQSPSFFGYFPASASTAGFLGEMLCTGFNVVGFNWASSPAATELESVVKDWMAKMLKLPDDFLFASGGGGGGVLYGSTCEAILCTLAAARDKALENTDGQGITRLVIYASDQTHSTVQKAAKLVGIPPSNFRTIATTSRTGYGLCPKAVRSAMEADVANGLIPLYLCATVGTTTINAVDPINDLGILSNSFGVWLHVDAAYAGNAAICPEFRQYLDGVELADSISMNPHKWFLTNMDCCCMWVKNSSHLVESLSTNPEYLKNKASEEGDVVDYKDWQMALSRRFRAIKMWVVLRRYGLANLREHIRDDVRMAERLEGMVRADGRFEVVGERRFALVCFRLRECGDAENRKLLDEVNNSRKAFITHAKVEEKIYLRMAVGATLTEDRHVDATWRLIQTKASAVLGCKSGRP